VPQRCFPPPWSVDEADPELDRRCFIVRDANGQALSYAYFDDEPGRRAAAKLLTRELAFIEVVASGRGAKLRAQTGSVCGHAAVDVEDMAGDE
jgi:hypothetical protein